MVSTPTPAMLATPGVPAVTANGVALPATRKLVTLGVPPSTSVVSASKPVPAGTVRVAFCVTVLASLPSTGASFTGVTGLIVTVAGLEGKPWLSVTV